MPLSAPANVRLLRAAELDIWTAEPLPVSVGPKLIGQTPVSFRIDHGALSVISYPPPTLTGGSAAGALRTTVAVLGSQAARQLGVGKQVPVVPLLGAVVFGWLSQPTVAQAVRRLRK
jgi:hypothetical protein